MVKGRVVVVQDEKRDVSLTRAPAGITTSASRLGDMRDETSDHCSTQLGLCTVRYRRSGCYHTTIAQICSTSVDMVHCVKRKQ